MQTSADLSLILIISVISAVVYLFKIHQGALILALSTVAYFVQNLALKTSKSLAIDGVNQSNQQQIIFTIMMLVPLLIVILKYRKKNKLGMIKSIIGSVLVALFFVLTAGVYIPIIKNFVMGPLFLNINKYSFQISLAAFVWMGIVYFGKKDAPPLPPKK